MAKFPWRREARSATVSLDSAVCVIGLGRFGTALALELMRSGVEVLGIDSHIEPVQELDGHLTHVVRGDATREETLRQLGVNEFDRVVVAIGSDVEASILTTSLLLKFKVENIWAKAVSEPHAEILAQLGVHHVISPEKDMGRRVAHLVLSSMQDFIEIGDDFVLVKITPPAAAVGAPLIDLHLRTKYGTVVTAYRRGEGEWAVATPDVVLRPDDVILVAGRTKDAEAFTRLPR